jgi:hypothetical protein
MASNLQTSTETANSVEENTFQVNDEQENLITEHKQLKYNATESFASTSINNNNNPSSSSTNLFGISTTRNCPTCNG